MPQERGIRGVFHQAPDQVGHSREQPPDGEIDAHPLSVLNHRLAHRFAHAVEHLNFIAMIWDAELLGQDDGMSQAADIVAAEGGINNIVVFK